MNTFRLRTNAAGRSIEMRVPRSLTGIILASILTCTSGGQPDLDVLPLEPLQRLALQGDELPAHFVLLPTNALPREMNMKSNPGYIGNHAELEQVARYGGLASFAAFYGATNETRIILGGIYFRDAPHCDAFVEMQRQKKRFIRAFRLSARRGTWLLLIARDPTVPMTAEDLEAFAPGFERYRRRLGLTPCFDSFSAPGRINGK